MQLKYLRRALGPCAALLFAIAPVAFGAADGSHLDLPVGEDVAIVVFEDLQCPDCAKAHPQLVEIARSSGVPLLIRDFPLPRHAWAFPAAILARHFAFESPEAAVDFRSFLFANQQQVRPENLRSAAEQFAKARGVPLPENVDPNGRLQDLVRSDYELGRLIGVEYVPLVLVLGRGQGASRFTEVKDLAQLAEAVAKMKQGAPVRRAGG